MVFNKKRKKMGFGDFLKKVGSDIKDGAKQYAQDQDLKGKIAKAKDKVKETATEVGEKAYHTAQEVGSAVKDKTIEEVGRTEKDIREGRGLAGKVLSGINKVKTTVRETTEDIAEKGGLKQIAKDKYKDIGVKIDDAKHQYGGWAGISFHVAQEISKKTYNFSEEVKAEGGYGTYFGNRINSAKESVTKKVNTAYGKIQDTFLDENGNLDTDKMRQTLSNEAGVAAEYGKEGLDLIKKYAKLAKDKTKEVAMGEFRKKVPTEEERQTTYAGIGSAEGFYTRDQLDNTVALHNAVAHYMKDKEDLKNEILDEIKLSVSGSISDLGAFYFKEADKLTSDAEQKSARRLAERKLDLIIKYIPSQEAKH